MDSVTKTKVLMVCLGNICRSPLAEGILRNLLIQKGLDHLVEVDSAGTSDFHIGKLPDPRSRDVASLNGFELTHRSRQLKKNDFQIFDYILVMDFSNLENSALLTNAENEKSKVQLITKFDLRQNSPEIVPDPYWGDINHFINIFEQLTYCCEGWIKFHLEALSKK